jgi:hypothetical protein
MMVIAAILAVSGATSMAEQQSRTETKAIMRTEGKEPSVSVGRPAGRETRPGIGKLYAVVVGVSQYHHPRIPDLKLADDDAGAFARFLESQREVFEDTRVTLLLDEQATKREIEKQLHYELRKAGKDDTVVLFLSGHGAGDARKAGSYYFLGHDADPDFLHASAVRMSGLEFLKGLDAKRVVLVADACHAGAFSNISTKAAVSSHEAFLKDLGQSAGHIILTSSRPDEYSQEKQGMPHSVFTHYLLKALKGEADSDRDGLVTVREAYDYAYERTNAETGGGQHPQIHGKAEGSFPLSVVKALDEPIELEVQFVAQDPRCRDTACLEPARLQVRCGDPLCRDISIEDDDTLYAGQNYQIGLRLSEPGYAYVYQVDDQGGIYRLFPGEQWLAQDNQLDNPIQANVIHWIPAKNAWLRLADQPGHEKIYVVASRCRNAVLEDLYRHVQDLREKGGKPQQLMQAQASMQRTMVVLMGPSRVVHKASVSKGGADRKTEAFERTAKIFASPTLDAVESVAFRVRPRSARPHH